MSEHERQSVRLAACAGGGGEARRLGSALERPTVRLACAMSPPERDGGAFDRPTVRLAVNGPLQAAQARNGADPLAARPTVRLAQGNGSGAQDGKCFVGPTGRLASGTAGIAAGDFIDGSLAGEQPADFDRAAAPALLVSYVYAAKVRALMPRWAYRDWVLDSGAFSAFNSGTEIRLPDYIDYCRRALDEDPTLTEVFALDVIGDWRASLRNTEAMWAAGVPAIPCFHVGEPEDALRGMARDYPKIALGGVALKHAAKKLDWARKCFDRIWPCRVHGFAFCGEAALMALPWDSVDATNWQIGPTKFGNWKTIGSGSWRGSRQNLRSEVQWYLDLERRARERWRATWAAVNIAPREAV